MGSVVTVAELMRRCAPAPEVADDGAAPIPVSALLRREGRSATGLPVVQTPAVGEILSTLPARQPLLRRGAMAAGALLAAGSVFGLTAAMNAPFTPPTSSGTFPDQGDPSGPGSPTVLDAGQAAPSTWLPVAFPTLFPEANAPAPQAAAPRVAQPVAAQAPAANSGGTARQASSGGSPATSARAQHPGQEEGRQQRRGRHGRHGRRHGEEGRRGHPAQGRHRRARQHGLRRRPPGWCDHRPDHRPDHGAAHHDGEAGGGPAHDPGDVAADAQLGADEQQHEPPRPPAPPRAARSRAPARPPPAS